MMSVSGPLPWTTLCGCITTHCIMIVDWPHLNSAVALGSIVKPCAMQRFLNVQHKSWIQNSKTETKFPNGPLVHGLDNFWVSHASIPHLSVLCATSALTILPPSTMWSMTSIFLKCLGESTTIPAIPLILTPSRFSLVESGPLTIVWIPLLIGMWPLMALSLMHHLTGMQMSTSHLLLPFLNPSLFVCQHQLLFLLLLALSPLHWLLLPPFITSTYNFSHCLPLLWHQLKGDVTACLQLDGHSPRHGHSHKH